MIGCFLDMVFWCLLEFVMCGMCIWWEKYGWNVLGIWVFFMYYCFECCIMFILDFFVIWVDSYGLSLCEILF